MPYCPFRHSPRPVAQVGFVRLACLIHAAIVRSEPGSNPSRVFACGGCPPFAPSRPSERAARSKIERKEFEVALPTNSGIGSRSAPRPWPCDQRRFGLPLAEGESAGSAFLT